MEHAASERLIDRIDAFPRQSRRRSARRPPSLAPTDRWAESEGTPPLVTPGRPAVPPSSAVVDQDPAFPPFTLTECGPRPPCPEGEIDREPPRVGGPSSSASNERNRTVAPGPMMPPAKSLVIAQERR